MYLINFQIHFWPEKLELFATAGCKRVSQKIDELLYAEEDEA
jgi:hypothetical protein